MLLVAGEGGIATHTPKTYEKIMWFIHIYIYIYIINRVLELKFFIAILDFTV